MNILLFNFIVQNFTTSEPKIILNDEFEIVGSSLLINGQKKNYMNLNKEQSKKLEKLINQKFKLNKYDLEKSDYFFILFKMRYKKKFANKYIEAQKFHNFKNNLEIMNKINSENQSFKVRINERADMWNPGMPKGLMKNLNSETQRINILQ